MVLTPSLLQMFARDVVQAEHPDAAKNLVLAGAAEHREQLLALTGQGVVPGTSAPPEFHVKRRVYVTKAQRAIAGTSKDAVQGSPADEPGTDVLQS